MHANIRPGIINVSTSFQLTIDVKPYRYFERTIARIAGRLWLGRRSNDLQGHAVSFCVSLSTLETLASEAVVPNRRAINDILK